MAIPPYFVPFLIAEKGKETTKAFFNLHTSLVMCKTPRKAFIAAVAGF